MKTLEPTDLAFFDTAPLRIVATARFAVPPAHVFEAFADPDTWPRWFPLMTRAAWTKGEARVGAERDVALTLLGRFRERIIAWEPGKRFAFTMVGSTSPLADRLAEDYRLAPDAGGTRLDWVMAGHPTAVGKLLTPAVRAMMKQIFRRAGKNLDHLLSTN